MSWQVKYWFRWPRPQLFGTSKRTTTCNEVGEGGVVGAVAVVVRGETWPWTNIVQEKATEKELLSVSRSDHKRRRTPRHQTAVPLTSPYVSNASPNPNMVRVRHG